MGSEQEGLAILLGTEKIGPALRHRFNLVQSGVHVILGRSELDDTGVVQNLGHQQNWLLTAAKARAVMRGDGCQRPLDRTSCFRPGLRL